MLLVICGLIVFAWRSQVGASREREWADRAVAAEQDAVARSIEEFGGPVDVADSGSRQAVEPDDASPHEHVEVNALQAAANKLSKSFGRADSNRPPQDSAATILQRIN